VPKRGEVLNFDEMSSFFRERHVALYKIPERLELIHELPLVAGGNKINKRQLEEEIQTKLASEK
ncbi:MAG: o-succinylbenzoate--CoA ligase, partial [Deltaproteobacteria bacterium]|nr:o-succinylbenzoate--CoA ligase [Deltaproteobacteria bacterium]